MTVLSGKRKASGGFRDRRLTVEKSRVRSAEPAKGISSVVAFHEKAGRSQGGPSVATLSKFQKHNPVANPNPGDFEPDGTWYSMVEAY